MLMWVATALCDRHRGGYSRLVAKANKNIRLAVLDPGHVVDVPKRTDELQTFVASSLCMKIVN